jgi:hypothetical protein
MPTKVYSTWVLHLLTPDTDDESLFYYYQPESKRSSKQWKRAGSPPPTKRKQEKSTNKVLHSFFWDYKGIILKEPVPVSMTITKTYY